MMKKKMAWMLCVFLVAGLAGCGDNNNGSSTVENPGDSSVNETGSPAENNSAEADGSGSGTAGTEEAKDYSDTEFRIAWWGGDARNTQTVEIIENFEKKYPNLKIDVEYATYGDYFTNLTTQATAGNLPDVYMMDYSRINEFVDAGQMEQLDSYIEAGSINLSDVDDSLVAGGIVNGGMYAIATGTNAPCGFYDATVLEELDISLSQVPTWSEFSDVITQVYEKTGKRAFINPNTGNLQSYMRSVGKDTYAADGAGYGFAPEDMVEYLTYIYDLYESGAAVSSAEYEGEEGASLRDGNDIWLKQNGAEFSNQLMAEEDGAGKRLTLVAHPSAENSVVSGTYLKPVMLWGISSTSLNKEIAADFINYFVNEPSVYDVCGADRGIPISAAMRDHLVKSMSESEAHVLEFISYLSDGVATAISPAAPTGSAEADTYLNELMEQLQYKQLKKEQLLDAVTTAVEEGAAVLKQAAAGE